jgi:hypothetical protein
MYSIWTIDRACDLTKDSGLNYTTTKQDGPPPKLYSFVDVRRSILYSPHSSEVFTLGLTL